MYTMTQVQITGEQGEKIHTYGIACEEDRIDDICSDREAIEKLVRLCTRLGLSPVHLRDIVEDFLEDWEN